MATIREQIISTFTARYGAGTLRGSVVNAFDDVATGPVTGVIDGDEDASNAIHGSVNCTMVLRVERIEELDTATHGNASTQGNAALGTLISTATSSDRTLGGLCSSIKYTGGGVDLASVSSDVVGAFAEFDVEYKFDIGDPDTDSYP